MTNEPPEPGAPEPEPPEDPSTRPLPAQTPPPPAPQQPPPGYPPPPGQPPYSQPPYSHPPYPPPGPPPPGQSGPGQPGPYAAPPPQQPGPYGQPPQPGNPYAQPRQPPPTQPVWQGHQAPQQQYPQPYGWPGQPPPYGPPQAKRRRGLLIGLLALLALALVGAAVVTALLLTDDSGSGIAVKGISPGDCLVGSGLADADEEIRDLERVDCNKDHDAEVFATFELGAHQDLDAAGSQCVDEAADAGRTLDDLKAADMEIRPLVASDSPEGGDEVVCFIRHPDGSTLSGSEFE